MAQNFPTSTQRIAACLRDNAEGIGMWGDVVGSVKATSGFQRRHVDLDNPIAFLKLFKTTLEFAISPCARRHLIAEAMGITVRSHYKHARVDP